LICVKDGNGCRWLSYKTIWQLELLNAIETRLKKKDCQDLLQ
jgi:hypothetical protein